MESIVKLFKAIVPLVDDPAFESSFNSKIVHLNNMKPLKCTLIWILNIEFS